MSVTPALVNMEKASHVTLRGLIFEACRGTAIDADGRTDVQIVGCTIRNTGSWAVALSGSNSSVVGCDIYETGDGGITSRRRRPQDAHPRRPRGRQQPHPPLQPLESHLPPGDPLDGVGNRATHNLIDNAPHQAIGFGGNDHLIEFNEIHSVCYESNDAGAIYAGRNWTMRGTVIRHNYFHHINGFEGRGCVGVYLDDQFCGTEIFGNLFYKVTRAAIIGGGRDCTIANNIFVDCVPATHVDARGLGWAASGFDGAEERPEAKCPTRTRFGPAAIRSWCSILDEDPMAPKGNLIARNICVGGRWGDFEAKAKPLVTFQDNLLGPGPAVRGPRAPATSSSRTTRRPTSWASSGFRWRRSACMMPQGALSWPVSWTVRPAMERAAH